MHHSSHQDPEMDQRLREMFEDAGAVREGGDELVKLGATGRFPGGKLTDQDEGEVQFRVGYLDGKIVLDFGQPVTWVGCSPEQAKDLARILLKHANPVTRP